MALQVEKILENGTVVNYHRLIRMFIDFEEDVVIAVVSGYVNREIRLIEETKREESKALRKASQELDILVAHPTPMNENRRRELSAVLNEAFERGQSHDKTALSIITQEFRLDTPANKDYTRGELYTLLKRLPDFEKAEDC